MANGGRPLVMGILNVTPDSFYDGGRYVSHERAIAKGRALFADGADVVDVGGESSRPGAGPVAPAEELSRILPVLEALAGEGRLSVDTIKPEVARRAVGAGATLINDVSGTLAATAAGLGVGWVAMHSRGTPRTMQAMADYDDVVGEVEGVLLELSTRAEAAGVGEIWLDPGIGFAKSARHNLQLLGRLSELVAAGACVGHGVLVGTSRKSFLGRIAVRQGSQPLPADERLAGSMATASWAVLQGAAMVRVHDVAETVRAVRLITEPVAA